MNYTFRAEVTKANLDIRFYAKCGKMSPSSIVETIQSTVGEELTSAELDVLAAMILEQYQVKWDKLGAVYDIEYDPIHNYLDTWSDESDGTKNEDESDSYTRTDTFGHTVGDTNLRTDNLTETVTYGRTETRTDNLTESEDSSIVNSGTSSENNGVYGFNSNTSVGSDTSSGSTSNTETVDKEVKNTGTQATSSGGADTTADTGTRTDARTITNSGSDGRSYSETRDNDVTDHRERSGSHSGNIGNLTSQKQIEEEINLWKWNYVNTILNDVKEFCTLPVYRCS